MKLHNQNILLISPEPWEHIFVSKHHYATHLAEKGNKVYFLNPPTNELSCKPTDHRNVFLVNYKGLITGLRFLPAFLQRFFIRQKFETIQKSCDIKFDIVWSFDNSVFFDFDALPKDVYCLSHIVDLNQDFEFEKASKTANLCLSSTKFILNRQLKFNANSHNIGHAFNENQNESNLIELPGEFSTKCGYAGNLDIQYIDWELIEILLNKFPEVGFYFVGNWKMRPKFSSILNKPNFFYKGNLPPQDLKAFYHSMDILLVIYKYQQYPQQLANPHKMMEYLGSGKMTLATWTEEYKDMNEKLILMSKNQNDFITSFGDVTQSLERWNSVEKSLLRKKYAFDRAYDKQIERIESLITN